MQIKYDVIICGAGPTGLMLAAQLQRFNINFLLVDKKSAPTNESRAVVLQARSMEIYEQMGLADEVIEQSVKTSGICFWRNGKKISEVWLRDFGSGITPFNYVIMFEQSKNEKLLYKYIQQHGKDVMWNTELFSFTETDGKFEATFTKNGESFIATAKYLIACDGAKSKLRELTAMQFTGGTYQNVFYVADTHVSAAVCADKLNFFVSKNTFNLLFPMQGEKRFRAIGILPEQFYHHDEISFDTMSNQVDKDAGMNLGFYDTQWYSTYRLHHKKVASFNESNIFFCGDAAHVHSPAGGQGMNTGLQDAYNLGWKLALVINKYAQDKILLTYHEERNPIAERLLKTTDRLFTLMSQGSIWNKLLRMYIAPVLMPLLMRMRVIRKNFFLLVSQTDINYKNSSLSKGSAGGIYAGMRLPYILLNINNTQQSIYYIVRNNTTPFLILYYNIQVESFRSGLINFIQVEKNNINNAAFSAAKFPTSFVCVVRPDNYIGYISEIYKSEEIQQYFANIGARI